jgi:hypothetical protein
MTQSLGRQEVAKFRGDEKVLSLISPKVGIAKRWAAAVITGFTLP